MDNDKKYKVDILKNDGSLKNIGVINPDGYPVINIPDYMMCLKLVTMKILKIIEYNDEYDRFNQNMRRIEGEAMWKEEFIKFYVIKRDLYRKGSLYYVCQESDRGIRFLVYVSHKIFHSSVALGTSIPMPSKNDIIQTFQKTIEESVRKESILQNIYNEDLYLL
jgi:hypothetical protein